MLIATMTFGLGLIAFGFTRSFWVALIVLPFVGAGFMVEMASTNTILQTITEERLRGRVMAFYTMAFFGSAPVGSLLAGVAADRIGASSTIILGGVACLAAGVWLMMSLPKMRQLVRPIYIERGILAASQVESSKTVGAP
jgi:MFS family permease